MKYVGDNLSIAAEDFECIEEGWSIGDETNGPHDWKYKILFTKPYGRYTELTSFIFFHDNKWWNGSIVIESEAGWDRHDILCSEVEPYECVVTKYRLVNGK